jgi:type II secretion system protein C
VFETEVIIRYIDRVRPWPWRIIVAVIVVSFLIASIASALLGWVFIGRAGKSESQNIEGGETIVIYPSETVAKLTIAKILERNLFNSEGAMGDVDPTVEGPQMAKTQLPIKVIGIIFGGTPFNGIAMIENTQNRTVNSFMVGDQMSPEAKLLEIQREIIIIDNQGRKEFAPIEEVELRRSTRKGGGKKVANSPESLAGSGYTTDAPPDSFKEEGFERKGGNIEMTAEYKSRLLTTDFASVLQDAKASPNLVDGVLRGWRMDRIRKNSFWEKSGMQNGDIIEEINGVALTDAGQSVKTLQSFRNESEVDIKVNRSGQKIILNLKVR